MTTEKKTSKTATKKAEKKTASQIIGKNGPNLAYLKDMAKNLNVPGYSKLAKPQLIHAIQLAEGNIDCYERIVDCTLYECLYYVPCQLR